MSAMPWGGEGCKVAVTRHRQGGGGGGEAGKERYRQGELEGERGVRKRKLIAMAAVINKKGYWYQLVSSVTYN